MTLPQLAGRLPRDPAALLSLAEAAVVARRGWSGGMVMEDPPEGDPPSGGGGGDDPIDVDPNATIKVGDRTWKVSDLQRIAAEEKRQGKRSGERGVLEALGVDNVDAAKELIAAAKKQREAEESEAQRAKREAEEARQTADRERAEAAAERRQSSLERALVRQGVNDDDLDDAVLLLDRGLDKDADADAILDAAKKLKERRAELFDGEAPPSSGSGRRDLPPGDKKRKPGTPGRKFGEGGLARAERRFGKRDGAA